MKEYSMELCGVKRTLPFIPISEEMAFASFVVLGDTELVSACAPELAAKIGEVDAIVTAEAKGIALAYEVSKELGHKEFIVARKSTKSYMKDVVSASVHSITTAVSSIFIWMEKTQIKSAANVSACWMMSFPPASPCTHWNA